MNGNTLKIIQISDSHLFSSDEMEMFGVKTNLKLNEVIKEIKANDLSGTDYIFLTGDVSQDETSDSYQKIMHLLGAFKIPVYWIPGNHDDTNIMESIFSKNINFVRKRRLYTDAWDFIFLNTKEDGTGEGYLSEIELDNLKADLTTHTDKNIALVMHHHPIKVETPLIDNYILKNREPLWDLIQNTNVKLILCGHVHGDYKIEKNGVILESAPATCLQWKKGTKELQIENKIGYKVYYFDKKSYQVNTKIW